MLLRLRQAIAEALIDITYGPTRLTAALPDHLPQLLECMFRELCKLHRQLLEYHIVLCQRARLIRQQIRDAAQFLRDGRVTRDAALDVRIVGDAVRVVDLRHVQVHTQGDRDDRGEEEHEAEVLEVPRALETV